LASLASSILIGTLWTMGGMDTAFRFAAVAFLLAFGFGVWTLRKPSELIDLGR